MTEKELLKIENHEDLARDPETQAVINTDLSSLEQYKQRRNEARKKNQKIEKLSAEVSEIKDMLKQLLRDKT